MTHPCTHRAHSSPSSTTDEIEVRTSLLPTLNCKEYSHGDFFTALEATGQLSYDYQPSKKLWSEAHNRCQSEGGYIAVYDDVRSTRSSSTNRNNFVRGVVSIGFGRMYSGYHAATAIYFCDELRKRGLLRKELEYDQLLALTELVYQRRLLHAIDSREFQIETWQQLLDYAQSEGLIDSSNTASLVLQDVWRYFPTDARKFGWQVSFGRAIEFSYTSGQSLTTETHHLLGVQFHKDSVGVVDTISYDNTKYTRSSHNKNTTELQYLTLGTKFSRPLSLKWQFDGSVEGRAYLNNQGKFRLK